MSSAVYIVITVVLILVIVVQISKVSEYVAILRGKEKAQQQSNKLNAGLMLASLVIGFLGVYLCNEHLKGYLLPKAASVQGEAIDHLIMVTLIITGIVFIITHIMLFGFAYLYRARPGHKAQSFPKHNPKNDKLEIIWTSATLLVLLVLIVFGLKEWAKITGPAPANAKIVEVTGKQFNWMFRYPGHDGSLGQKNYTLIDPAASNPLGQDWSDPANRDDVVSNGVMHLVVDKPVRLIINSQDVIHDVGLPYFRLKMDAVPGMPTTLWFTPTITTKEMIKITGDPNFVYELACDQLCGNGHYSMRATIIVQTQEEFDKWIDSQKSQYQYTMVGKEDSPQTDQLSRTTTPAQVDSAAKLAKR